MTTIATYYQLLEVGCDDAIRIVGDLIGALATSAEEHYAERVYRLGREWTNGTTVLRYYYEPKAGMYWVLYDADEGGEGAAVQYIDIETWKHVVALLHEMLLLHEAPCIYAPTDADFDAVATILRAVRGLLRAVLRERGLEEIEDVIEPRVERGPANGWGIALPEWAEHRRAVFEKVIAEFAPLPPA